MLVPVYFEETKTWSPTELGNGGKIVAQNGSGEWLVSDNTVDAKTLGCKDGVWAFV